MSIRKLVYLSAIVLFSGVPRPLLAQNSSAQADLQKKLAATYTITTVTKDRSDIVTPGVVVALQKDNLLAYSTTAPLPPVNTYKKGKISQGWGGFGRDLLITTMQGGSGTATDFPRQTFHSGDKLWVVGIAVSNSNIGLVLYSDPDANNLRYYGQLNIPFHKKGEIPSADDALKMVSEVLAVQPPDTSEQSSSAAAQPAAPPLTPLAPPAGVPSAPALAPLAAPPPPPAAPPAPPTKISMGETTGQVRSSLGEPQKVVSLGAKEIDFYPNLKITFVNGKVTSLE